MTVRAAAVWCPKCGGATELTNANEVREMGRQKHPYRMTTQRATCYSCDFSWCTDRDIKPRYGRFSDDLMREVGYP